MSDAELKILAGSGRSGTTWLQDVLCQSNKLSAVFEPLHPAALKRAIPFSRKYAGGDHEWPQLEAFWQDIAQARYSKWWSIYRVRPDRLVPKSAAFTSINGLKRYLAHWFKLIRNRKIYSQPKQATDGLVKVIRANLMLPYLVANIDAKIVFVIRHPAAVVESQLRLGRDWNAQRIAGQYVDDERLEQRLGHRWSTLVSKMTTDAEIFTLVWCLENLIPIEDLQHSSKVRFLFYEKLADLDTATWQRLLDGFNLEHMPSVAVLNKPSQQASENMSKTKAGAREAGSRQLDAPLSRLNSQQKEDIQRVLNMFNVSMYDTGSIWPQHENVAVDQPWCGAAVCGGGS